MINSSNISQQEFIDITFENDLSALANKKDSGGWTPLEKSEEVKGNLLSSLSNEMSMQTRYRANEIVKKVYQLAIDHERIVELSLLGNQIDGDEAPEEVKNPQTCGATSTAVLVFTALEFFNEVTIKTTESLDEVENFLSQKKIGVMRMAIGKQYFIDDDNHSKKAFFPGHALTVIKFCDKSKSKKKTQFFFKSFQSYIGHYHLSENVQENWREYLTESEFRNKVFTPWKDIIDHKGKWTVEMGKKYRSITGVEHVDLVGKSPELGRLENNYRITIGIM